MAGKGDQGTTHGQRGQLSCDNSTAVIRLQCGAERIGGLIVPFFNQFIDAAATNKISGWVKNPNGEMMDGNALNECWLNA